MKLNDILSLLLDYPMCSLSSILWTLEAEEETVIPKQKYHTVGQLGSKIQKMSTSWWVDREQVFEEGFSKSTQINTVSQRK